MKCSLALKLGSSGSGLAALRAFPAEECVRFSLRRVVFHKDLLLTKYLLHTEPRVDSSPTSQQTYDPCGLAQVPEHALQ